MPRVPEINVQVQRVQGTSAGQSIQTNADMFGGLQARQSALKAQTMGNMVKGLTGIGSTVLGYLEKQQEEEDKLLVDQLDYEFNSRLQQERLSYSQMQGNQAMDGFEPYNSRIDEINEEYSQRLKNDRQKQLWTQRFQHAALSHRNYLGGHYVREKQKFQINQNAMLIDQKVNLASEAFLSGDENAKALAMSEALRAMEDGERLHGQYDPATIGIKSEELYSKVVERTVEQLLGNQQDAQAIALYNDEIDSLSPKTRATLEPKVRKLERDLRIKDHVQSLLQQNLSRSEMLSAVDQQSDIWDEDRAEIKAQAIKALDAAKKERQAQLDNLKTGLQEQIAAANFDISRVDPQAMEQLRAVSPKEARELEKWAGEQAEGTFTTDPDAYIALQAGLASGAFKKPGWTEAEIRARFGTRVRKADLDSAIESLNGTAKIPDDAFNRLAQRYLSIATKDLNTKDNLPKFERFKDELKMLAERNGDYSDKALDRYAAYLVEQGEGRKYASWLSPDRSRIDAMMAGDTFWEPFAPEDQKNSIDDLAKHLKLPKPANDLERDRFYKETYQPLKLKMDTLLDKYPSLRGMDPLDLMKRIAEYGSKN